MKIEAKYQFTSNHHDPFGMLLVGRNWEGGTGYRFGFNGQMRDDEIYGNGNGNTAEYWEYDTRLGRRWNKDPIVKEHESSYVCFANNPIFLIDIDGNNAWKPEQNEDGSTTLVAEEGDNAETLEQYFRTTGLSSSVTYSELEQYSEQLDTYTSENNGSSEGMKINSPKFNNIVGSTLMKMYSGDPSCHLLPKGAGNEECSPTSWNRSDQATEIVYNSDILGKNTGSNSGVYRAWTMWRSDVPPELVDVAKYGGAKVVTYLNLGYEVTTDQAMKGALKPGAILNLQSPDFGHSAIFVSYIYGENEKILGFTYWQQYSGEGYPKGSYLGSGIFGDKSRSNYIILTAANWY